MEKELRKETLKILRSGENIFDIYGIPGTSSYENLKEASKKVSNYIDKLQKELEEKTTILMAGADKVKQLEKENEELEKTIEQSLAEQKERDKYTHELEKRLDKLQKENISRRQNVDN